MANYSFIKRIKLHSPTVDCYKAEHVMRKCLPRTQALFCHYGNLRRFSNRKYEQENEDVLDNYFSLSNARRFYSSKGDKVCSDRLEAPFRFKPTSVKLRYNNNNNNKNLYFSNP